jgi:hypothetical protein
VIIFFLFLYINKLILIKFNFSKNKYWNSTKFSNLALGNKGTVNFEVEVSVDPEIVVYSPEFPASISAVNKDDQSLSAGDELDGLDGINLDLDNL